MPKEGKVIVSGVNVHARHRKPIADEPAGRDRAQGSAAARVERRDRRPQDGKPTRVRFEERDGKKVRVAAKTGELIHG